MHLKNFHFVFFPHPHFTYGCNMQAHGCMLILTMHGRKQSIPDPQVTEPWNGHASHFQDGACAAFDRVKSLEWPQYIAGSCPHAALEYGGARRAITHASNEQRICWLLSLGLRWASRSSSSMPDHGLRWSLSLADAQTPPWPCAGKLLRHGRDLSAAWLLAWRGCRLPMWVRLQRVHKLHRDAEVTAEKHLWSHRDIGWWLYHVSLRGKTGVATRFFRWTV
jgi:hypothetical protein